MLTQAILAALTPDDSAEEVKQKVALVADFLDIWLARRIWNFRTISYSSVRYTLFNLTKEFRGRSAAELSELLRRRLDEQHETFARQPRFRLHNQNYRQVRHVLARLTHWVDTRCGMPSNVEDLISKGTARPFEIEHIWANHYDRYQEWFEHTSDFETERGRIGGLLLLQRGVNQSLGDATYEAKRDAYLSHSENLLARSLHPLAYENNPSFRRLIEQTGLPFRPHDGFTPDDQALRQELYVRIAESVWNPSRLDLDGEKAPVFEAILDPEEETGDLADRPDRLEARFKFWTALLEHAKTRSDLHARISPGRSGWISSRHHDQWWNYVVLQDETRAELVINSPVSADNEALFDRLHACRADIESDFGGPLEWQRLDGKRVCRIRFSTSGGWVDESAWPKAIEVAVDAMCRLNRAAVGRL